jgi:hypothetical protein
MKGIWIINAMMAGDGAEIITCSSSCESPGTAAASILRLEGDGLGAAAA